MTDSFRVIAIISAFNEGDIISPVIGHLVENGVDVYLIDNHSTDDTVEQANQWLGRGLLHVESFPKNLSAGCEDNGLFDWTAILRRKEQLAAELSADWFIHHDADEIREGPWPGLTLKDAIRWVDGLGYNCIDFRVLNFPPVDDDFKRGDDPRSYFTFFENVPYFDQVQLKCWKAGKAPVSLASSGGHEVRFEARRTCPIPFLLRHYPIRGQKHGVRKVFRERKGRLIESERSRGWHVQYDQIADEKHCFLKDPAGLTPFNLNRARLELMLPEKVLRDLVDRLFRTEEELDNFRAKRDELEKRSSDLANERDELAKQVASLQGEQEEQSKQASNLERQRDALQNQMTNLERERDEIKQQIAALQREHDQLRQSAVNVEQERDDYRRRVPTMEGQRRDLEQHNRSLEQELSGLRNSRSWRWTAPLRWLFDLGSRLIF